MFSWGPRKAIANFEKHRVSFEEAATIFADTEGLDWEDLTHSNHETGTNESAYRLSEMFYS